MFYDALCSSDEVYSLEEDLIDHFFVENSSDRISNTNEWDLGGEYHINCNPDKCCSSYHHKSVIFEFTDKLIPEIKICMDLEILGNLDEFAKNTFWGYVKYDPFIKDGKTFYNLTWFIDNIEYSKLAKAEGLLRFKPVWFFEIRPIEDGLWINTIKSVIETRKTRERILEEIKIFLSLEDRE